MPVMVFVGRGEGSSSLNETRPSGPRRYVDGEHLGEGDVLAAEVVSVKNLDVGPLSPLEAHKFAWITLSKLVSVSQPAARGSGRLIQRSAPALRVLRVKAVTDVDWLLMLNELRETQFPSLELVSFSETDLDLRALREVLRTFPRVRVLDLRGVKTLDTVEQAELAGRALGQFVETNTELRELNLVGTPLRDWRGPALLSQALGHRIGNGGSEVRIHCDPEFCDVGLQLAPVDSWESWLIWGRLDSGRRCNSAIALARALSDAHHADKLEMHLRRAKKSAEDLNVIDTLWTSIVERSPAQVKAVHLVDFDLTTWSRSSLVDLLTATGCSELELVFPRGPVHQLLQRLPRLKSLAAEGGSGWDFRFIEHTRELVSLRVVACEFAQSDLIHLVRTLNRKVFANLQTIELIDLGINEAVMEAWESQRQTLPLLGKLDLTDNPIEYDGIVDLCRVVKFLASSHLREVRVCLRDAGPEGARELQQVQREIDSAAGVSPESRLVEMDEHHRISRVEFFLGLSEPDWVLAYVDVTKQRLVHASEHRQTVEQLVVALRASENRETPAARVLGGFEKDSQNRVARVLDMLADLNPHARPRVEADLSSDPDQVAQHWARCEQDLGGPSAVAALLVRLAKANVLVPLEVFAPAAVLARRCRLGMRGAPVTRLDVLACWACAWDRVLFDERYEHDWTHESRKDLGIAARLVGSTVEELNARRIWVLERSGWAVDISYNTFLSTHTRRRKFSPLPRESQLEILILMDQVKEPAPLLSSSLQQQLVSALGFEKVLCVTPENDGIITYGDGSEFVWPSGFRLSENLTRTEFDDRRGARLAGLIHLSQLLIQNHTRDIIKMGPDGLWLWRPKAQRAWNGEMRVDVGQKPSRTGAGGRSLCVACPPCLKFEYDFDTDSELDGELDRLERSCEKNGWGFRVKQDNGTEWSAFCSPAKPE